MVVEQDIVKEKGKGDDKQEEVEEEEEEEEEAKEPVDTCETAPSRSQRGVPRRNARRARGRRVGAAVRTRVVSTRIYGARRNAIQPVNNDKETHNETLEETIQTESDESPMKTTPALSSKVETESNEGQTATPIVAASVNETTSTSTIENNASSNIRVSGKQ
jgi:hypothetical protein